MKRQKDNMLLFGVAACLDRNAFISGESSLTVEESLEVSLAFHAGYCPLHSDPHRLTFDYANRLYIQQAVFNV